MSKPKESENALLARSKVGEVAALIREIAEVPARKKKWPADKGISAATTRCNGI
jgi:hypothetical protein